MSTPDLLTVQDLSVEFGMHGVALRALDSVSLRVRAGSTVALVGESGSGKSVLSQCIMGILPRAGRITGGRILFADHPAPGRVLGRAPGGPRHAIPPIDLAALPPDGSVMQAIRGGRISIIFQEPMSSLSPLHSIGDQVGEALHLHRDVGRAAGRDLVTDMLRLVGFPDPVRALRTYPFELSGGLRQRAMIAMALVCRPALLIADEPTTALDVTIQAQILKLLQDLQAELGMAVLMITHDLGVVANLAEEVVVLYRGRVVESGTRDAIFRQPEHPYLRALLRAVPRFGMAPGERLQPLRAVQPRAGGLLAGSRPAEAASQAGGPPPPLLRVEGVRKSFRIRRSGLLGEAGPAIVAVDDVSLSIQRGECFGLVGESGCGKTTLSKVILRALSADAGRVIYEDADGAMEVTALNDRALLPFRRKVQFIFQDPYGSLNPRMTVADILAEPLLIHGIGDARERRARIAELMELVGLDPRQLSRYPHSFSGGQRQRIGIARALALRPRLLICDEPVSALDVSIQAQVLNLLKDLQTTFGLTYLFISHNLAVVDYMAHRIAVMCAGRLVEVAAREQLFRDPRHPYTQALLSAVPDPDPDRRLDLTALQDGRASDPRQWPMPYTEPGDGTTRLMAVADGHWVRMAADAAPRAA